MLGSAVDASITGCVHGGYLSAAALASSPFCRDQTRSYFSCFSVYKFIYSLYFPPFKSISQFDRTSNSIFMAYHLLVSQSGVVLILKFEVFVCDQQCDQKIHCAKQVDCVSVHQLSRVSLSQIELFTISVDYCWLLRCNSLFEVETIFSLFTIRCNRKSPEFSSLNSVWQLKSNYKVAKLVV